MFFLTFLVLSEVFVFRNLDVYGYSPGFIGQIAEIDNSFAHADASGIEAAVFGDSEGMDALRPNLLADAAHIRPDTLFNFSLSGGSAYDIAQMYELYKDRLPRLKRAIVEVNEFQLNNEDAASDIKFKFFAGLRDRLAVMNGKNYGELLLGWALKSYDMRTVWQMMIDKYRNDQLRKEVPLHQGGLPPVTWSPGSDKTRQHAEEVADRWFKGYRVEGVRTQAFEGMIRDMRQRGIEVVMIQLPRSSYFEEVIQTKYAAEQRRYMQKIQSIADRYGATYTVIPQGRLTLADFRDTNHVNPQGAAQISAYVGKRWLSAD
ncbi:hypothetical protein [Ferviditalea candida]|uniref:SGNH hydrolase-type esterase domain-containing protein n=1 Tax=Ferviditalea candida TaxID=3108399 RepID=A0ABU5ZJ38_9BACL|nr:hypothetical protein [Paenibacillaceae bacterium T2]